MSTIVRTALGLLLALTLACGSSDSLEEIRQSQEAGEFAKSIEALRRILDEDPSQAEASLLLGVALLRTGASALAVWPLRKAAETPEYAVEAGLLLTEAMLESRDAHDALREVDRVLAIEPDNVTALALRVDAHRSAGKLEESLADIERVLELDPENLPVLVTRVTALIALDRIDEAGEALDVAQASFDAGDRDVANPMLARLCVARALFAFLNDELDAAERHYADCAERFPTQQVAVTEIVAYYDRMGRNERATEILERAAEESESGLFHTQLARRLGALGKPEEEERILREEAETRDTVLSWFVLADYYVLRDRFDEAIEAFESAIAVGPASPRLRFGYADTLVQAERFDEAREVAKRLDKPELRSLIRGRILLGEGNAAGALAAFEAGIKLWPNNAVGRFLAGQAAERVGDFQRATSHYRESFRTNPGASEAGRALAELYALQGLHNDALQIASRYFRPHASEPEAFLLSVRIAHQAGRKNVLADGMQRLARMPGQAGTAAAEEASFLLASEGGSAEQVVELIESKELDLTELSNAVALRALTEQLGVLGQRGKAAELTAKALAAHPDEAAFHEIEGGSLQQAGQADSARASYERALEVDAENWRALAGLASLAAESGHSTEALALYERALAAEPEDSSIAHAAVALVRESNPGETPVWLERLLDQYPREAAAANELAGLLADRGELDRARGYAARAAWFRLPEAEETIARLRQLRATATGPEEQGAPSE